MIQTNVDLLYIHGLIHSFIPCSSRFWRYFSATFNVLKNPTDFPGFRLYRWVKFFMSSRSPSSFFLGNYTVYIRTSYTSCPYTLEGKRNTLLCTNSEGCCTGTSATSRRDPGCSWRDPACSCRDPDCSRRCSRRESPAFHRAYSIRELKI